jgi:iron complex outermembrane receptor protein
MQIAARYDDFSDFGDNLSPSVALRWQPLENLIVRASYTEGFKAPNLTSLNSNVSESFNNVNDVTQCRAQGVADEDCPTFQVRNFSGGNPNLEAEESEGWDIGVVWEPIDNLTLGLDYFETDLTNAIQQIGIQTLVNLQADGQPLPAGTAIIRGADIAPGVPGRIQQIITGNANVSEFNVSGLDAKVNYSYSTDTMGSFSGQLAYSKLFDYLFTSLPGADPSEQLNTLFTPDDRATLAVNWNYGDHTVAMQSYWIDASGPEGPTRVASFVNHNLTYIYQASWDAEISVGIRNLADRDPSISGSWGRTAVSEIDLYDVYGRTPFITYKQRF